MVSTATVRVASSTQNVTLPKIPELYDPNFLDVLVPAKEPDVVMKAPPAPSHPMMDALLSTTHQVLTENGAPAYSSTQSPTLDAFQLLTHHSYDRAAYKNYLDKAWDEDPGLTLRLIWNIRSIHDGKGDKEGFYQAFGWLYDHHPRTAISNLHLLVEPVCSTPKSKQGLAHGYWKDLLNILALATVDELNVPNHSKFLHVKKDKYVYDKILNKDGTPEQRIQASLEKGEEDKAAAKENRKQLGVERHQNLIEKLAIPKYRALYIAVARLFAERLEKDLAILAELETLAPDAEKERLALQKQITLVGKWAPTPAGSHDRHTNIATAVSLLLQHAQTPCAYPAALTPPTSLSPPDAAFVLRSFYQRWVLTPLRTAAQIPEALMAGQRWAEIRYARVPSVCMRNNTESFARHDAAGFEGYLIQVEHGRKAISGATLLPHELVAEAYTLGRDVEAVPALAKYPALTEVRQRLAETKLRVVEAQWKTLIRRLRESGALDNSLAICDVSGSMGSFGKKLDKRNVQPIFPAVALSLVLAHLAKPPFAGGVITFSADPRFVRLDLGQGLAQAVRVLQAANWGMNTDLGAVFLRLLLPLALEHKVAQEDMIKRLFVFSDMQFDEGVGARTGRWETNYDDIERAYEAAGYAVPQIVYWDVSRRGGGTVEVQAERRGVAMMNGFSPAMLKVFMGEAEEAEVQGWEKVGKDGEVEAVVEEEFNPVSVMRKALMKKSFYRLVVVD